MKKIYLAISNQSEITALKKILIKKYRDSSIVPAINNVAEVKEEVDLLITDSHSLEEVKSYPIKEIWLVNNKLKPETIGNVTSFSNFKSVSTWLMIGNLANPSVTGKGTAPTKSKPVDPAKNEKIEEKQVKAVEKVANDTPKQVDQNKGQKNDANETIKQSVDVESKKEVNENKVIKPKSQDKSTDISTQKRAEEVKLDPEDNIVDNEEEKESIDEDLDDTNYSKPVKVSDPYPEYDEKVIKKLQDDSKILQGENEKYSVAEFQQVESNPYSERAVAIRKAAFSHAHWDRNKTIGIWSPLHRMGVTTFVINYAIFLGKLGIPTSVVEVLTNFPFIKTTLKRYKSMPENWVSFITALHNSDIPAQNVDWAYKGVNWLPLDDNDIKVEWNKDLLKEYINNPKYYDFVLIDLPTGEMHQNTLDTLDYIDELWIMIDGSYQQILAWKKYIQDIVQKKNLNAKLIYTKHMSFSKEEIYSDSLGLPILATIPDLTKEIYQNYIEEKPLIENKGVYKILREPYNTITTSLIGKEYMEKRLQKNNPLFSRLKSLFETSP
ncbi:hypothetical protein [Bacillus sp. AFS040349]|uniref:hypothetical protein n=1 Tax=Bacillus sp. AFS040349 TaxID=2033502 RepID=UPI000BFE0A82|nr:hypothetical protein [Bacillus sp. AFS040349]PGT80589.1 hypothetical protein COD11_20990 [Bacillus sp. AFS040349]